MVATNEPALAFSDAEMKLLREKYNKLTDIEFNAFVDAARRYRLNPLANQFYARLQPATTKNPRAVTYMAQIDGFRLIAERTGQYAGNDDPVYDNESAAKPNKATSTVYRLVAEQRVPFSASARWKEYCPGGNAGFMWEKMPYLMLGKCAEALALRKAFPNELSGLYTVDEMHQAEVETEAPKQERTNGAKQAEKGRTKSTKTAAKFSQQEQNFALPPGWPDKTTVAEMQAWIDEFKTTGAYKFALNTFLQSSLVQIPDDWGPVLGHLKGRFDAKFEAANEEQQAAVQHIKDAIDAAWAKYDEEQQAIQTFGAEA